MVQPGDPGAAIRSGDWKLIEFYESDQVELYNLRDDLGEQRDLSVEQPAITQDLRTKLRDWQTRLRAKLPVPVTVIDQ